MVVLVLMVPLVVVVVVPTPDAEAVWSEVRTELPIIPNDGVTVREEGREEGEEG